MPERKLDLRVGPSNFVGPTWSSIRREKSFVLAWLAETEVVNILYQKILNIRPFRQPMFIYVVGFVPTGENSEEEN